MIGAAIGFAYQLYEADQAKGRLEEQAEIEWASTQEELRRMDREFAEREGMMKAQIATSGVRAGGGTAQASFEDTKKEFDRERSFVRRYGVSAAKNIRSQKDSLDVATASSGIDLFQAIGEEYDWWAE